MASSVHSCPQCGSIDLKRDLITNNTQCANCSWSGDIKETIGFATTERIWDIEKIGSVMLRIIATRAAGPLIQFLEFAGLIPKMMEVSGTDEEKAAAKQHNDRAQRIKDKVLRRICEVTITEAFTAAAEENNAEG